MFTILYHHLISAVCLVTWNLSLDEFAHEVIRC